MNKRHWPAIALAVGVLAAWTVFYLRGPSSAPVQIEDGTGGNVVVQLLRDPIGVPAFSVTDLEGKTMSTADWRGKVVLLNFWATWCGPCRAEIPDLVALQQKYRDHLVIVGISEDEGGVETVKRFATAMQMNYPIVMSTEPIRQIFKGVVALPTTFVLDRDGRMVQKTVGLLNKSRTEAVTRYLAGMDTTARIERVEDPTKLDLSNASEIKEIPGVDFSHVPAEQKTLVLQLLNAQGCTCGCGLTVAKCRVDDPTCPVSKPLAQSIVDDFINTP
jgi:thiol-disulfide isomerase/thioredoxin